MKSKSKSKKLIIKTISVDIETHKIIERLRKKDRRSYSAQIAFIVDEYYTINCGGDKKDGKTQEEIET